ncbi:M17 family metallopeptidase [Neptunicella marina]|uniref:Leucyl aminopeptidase family protein n=1 Tax=Neptunicella marina TaxID=2125989 RepID=A0A8J6ITA3_9ALTE|nr:leucyl aminopeptidase family protein [Neptunicella marina]MBC3765420.1 leucyl aminopeptidase family protein [Neptunicella marina]
MAFPIAEWVSDLDAALGKTSGYDGVILIAPESEDYFHPLLNQCIEHYKQFDQRLGREAVFIHSPELAGQRLIYSPTCVLDRDFDDVRRYSDAAKIAAKMAQNAGMVKPLMLIQKPDGAVYENALQVAYFGFCQILWQPLEAREALGESKVEPMQKVGLFSQTEPAIDWLNATEQGRRLARDLCGTEPERMAPPKFAEYCQQAFAGLPVKVTVLGEDPNELQQDYPLLYAVARASVMVKHHQPRVVRLEYIPEGAIEHTLLFAGKGVVYDTGGADIKTGGHMAGMSRDKGGAAAVAGFLKTAALLAPKGIKIIAELGVVRNSIGADAFVADEIIQSHAGVRVRIGNTDAEGRLVMADLLSHIKQNAVDENQPELFTVATLTGHAALAMGPYTALVDNGVARAHGCSTRLAATGEVWGDPCEISRSRREDFDFIRPRSLADDVLSSNNAPSSATMRGHQFPMAFLTVASGLDAHGINSPQPLSYTHIDIAGSGVEGGDWQHDSPTGAPVVALSARYLK